jgi:hypothetical protein
VKFVIFATLLFLCTLSISATIHKVGEYNTLDEALYVTVANNIAYLAEGKSGIQIIDVTDPQNPHLLGSYYTPGFSTSVCVVDTIAYVANQKSGLQILDVTKPSAPVLLGKLKPRASSKLNNVYIIDNFLLVSDGNWNEISIYDIRNQTKPILLSRYSWNLDTQGMCFENKKLYTANGNHGLNILDFKAIVPE